MFTLPQTKPCKKHFKPRQGFSKSSAPLTEAQAVEAILLCAAMADGVLAPEETQEISMLMSCTKTLRKISPETFQEFWKKTETKLDKGKGFDEVLDEAAKTLRALNGKREVAQEKAEAIFAQAVDVVCADRAVTEAEIEFLVKLSNTLKLKPGRASLLFEVVQIKNEI